MIFLQIFYRYFRNCIFQIIVKYLWQCQIFSCKKGHTIGWSRYTTIREIKAEDHVTMQVKDGSFQGFHKVSGNATTRPDAMIQISEFVNSSGPHDPKISTDLRHDGYFPPVHFRIITAKVMEL